MMSKNALQNLCATVCRCMRVSASVRRNGVGAPYNPTIVQTSKEATKPTEHSPWAQGQVADKCSM